MQKVEINGEIFFARFTDGDTTVVEEVTKEQYENGPTKEGWAFTDGWGGPRFDTQNGLLADGQYGDIGEYYLVKLEGCDRSMVDKSKIVDGVLDHDIEAAIVACGGKDINVWR